MAGNSLVWADGGVFVFHGQHLAVLQYEGPQASQPAPISSHRSSGSRSGRGMGDVTALPSRLGDDLHVRRNSVAVAVGVPQKECTSASIPGGFASFLSARKS